MGMEQILQKEIEESQRELNVPNDDTIHRRDLKKRIELINWILENMKNPDIQICEVIESRLDVVILKINQTHDIFEADKLHSELRILDWIFFIVCKDQQKN